MYINKKKEKESQATDMHWRLQISVLTIHSTELEIKKQTN